MKKKIKALVLAALPKEVKDAIRVPLLQNIEEAQREKMEFAQLSYSQEGEDILLNRVFNFKPQGVYVDIGAHHPKRFSNTYLFYKMGWRGINIDAMPGSMQAFKGIRTRDINLECGIGKERGRLIFHIFKEPALNTFDPEQARKNIEAGWELASTSEVDVFPLGEILEQNLPEIEASQIDFFSIDVEGFEINILQSNDWSRFSPRFILIEQLNFSLDGLAENGVFNFLNEKGYRFFAKTVNTVIYQKA